MSASTPFVIRRLQGGDEDVLAYLAWEDAAFEIDGRGEPRRPLDPAEARAYLANPAVLLWVAATGDAVISFISGLMLPLRSNDGHEVLLYEIGVHQAWRRRGVGRALLETMEAGMREQPVGKIWVLADNPGAVAFYRASGFAVEELPQVFMTRTVGVRR